MKRWLIVVLALLLSACASRETVFRADTRQAAQSDTPFDVSGRLSVRMNGRGNAASFDWAHSAARDQLSINTPLGNTVARLTRDAQGVTLESDGKSWQAADVESLMQQRLGWALPLDNLAWWIRGRPAPGMAASYAADGALQQQGWTIHFTADADKPSPYPKRTDLTRDDLSIRLVTDNWH